MENSTQQGLAALKAGNKSLARTLFRKAIQQSHEDVQAWLGLSAAVETDFEKVQCLQTIMKIDPENVVAKKALDQIVGRLFHTSDPKMDLNNPDISSSNANADNPFVVPSSNDPFEILRNSYVIANEQAENQQTSGSSAVKLDQKQAGKSEEKQQEPAARSYQVIEEKAPLPQEAWQPAAQQPEAPRKQIPKAVLIGIGIFTTLLFVVIMIIIAIAMFVSTAKPAQPVVPQAKPILAQDLTLTATNKPRLFLSPTVTQTPTKRPTRTPFPTATFSSPNQTVQARFDHIEEEVSDLRGLKILKKDIPVYPVTKVQVKDYFSKDALSEETLTELENRKQALVMLGLVKPTFDMMSEYINHMVDGIGGFYIPKDEEIFVIPGLKVGGMEFLVYAHEYDHALIDQHFDMEKIDADANCEHNSQKCQAIEAVIEGDATLLEEKWFKQYFTERDWVDIYMEPQPFYIPEDQVIPPYLYPDSAFSYDKGREFINDAYSSGSWAAVNKIYDRLPSSTEQILHPDLYRSNQLAIEVEDDTLKDALGENWEVIENDVLGEWMTYLILAYNADVEAQIDSDTARLAAAGWGGDRYQVFRNKASGSMVMAAHWVWDSGGDAKEFANVMNLMFENRYRGNRLSETTRQCWQGTDLISCFYHKDKDTLWLEAADESSINIMLDNFPKFK